MLNNRENFLGSKSKTVSRTCGSLRVETNPAGLCNMIGEWRRDVNKFAIHLDVVAPAGLRAEVSAGFTVDSDPARRDQFIAMPTRSDTRSGEEAI